MLVRMLVSGLMVFAATAAFGDNEGGQEQSRYGVSLDELRAKCAELTRNDQLKPIKATITCNQLQYEWVSANPSSATLPNTLNVGAAVRMKGFEVAHQFYPQDSSPTQIECQQFKKVEKKVDNIDVEIMCGELEAIQDLATYCKPIIADRVAQDPALLVVRDTAETQSLCPSAIR